MFSHFSSAGVLEVPGCFTLRHVRIMCGAALAQTVGAPSSKGDVLTIIKVDPPNWWAAMPKPMLLVRGEGFQGRVLASATRHCILRRRWSPLTGTGRSFGSLPRLRSRRR